MTKHPIAKLAAATLIAFGLLSACSTYEPSRPPSQLPPRGLDPADPWINDLYKANGRSWRYEPNGTRDHAPFGRFPSGQPAFP